MLNFIKKIIKGNQVLLEIAQKLIFFKDFFPKDVLNFKKLILFRKVYSYTMISYKRLSNIYNLPKIIYFLGYFKHLLIDKIPAFFLCILSKTLKRNNGIMLIELKYEKQ
jgi:hypothetical protein